MSNTSNISHKQHIDWHSGFAGGLGLGFQHYRASLDIEREHPLTKEPPRIDFLVIKKTVDVSIDNSVGRNFRKYNIIEYKNPTDELSIDTVWKTLGYAGLYKGYAKHINEIPEGELTITIFRTVYPRKLFKMWKENNREIETAAPGVYLLKGLIDIPLQIVVSKELRDDDFRALRIMAPNADEEEVRKFLTEASVYTEPGDRQDANAVLMVSSLANEDMYNRLYEEDENMRNVLQEIMKDELDEREKNGFDRGEKLGFDRGEKLGFDRGEKYGFEKGAQEERQKNEARISALEAEIKRLQQLIQTTD